MNEQLGVPEEAPQGAEYSEVIDASEFAKRPGLPVTWVRNHTRRGCRPSDEIPHVKLGALVRFEWGSPELNEWWKRHKRGGYPDPPQVAEGTPDTQTRSMARPVLRMDKDEERGARLAIAVTGSRVN
jgi:hypothetical protein